MPAYGAPDVIRAMIPSGIRVVETVSWAPAARDGSRTAAIRLDFPHHPLTLRGTLSLVGADGGTRATVARPAPGGGAVHGRPDRAHGGKAGRPGDHDRAWRRLRTGSPETTASTEEAAVSSQPVRGSAWRSSRGNRRPRRRCSPPAPRPTRARVTGSGPGSAASPSSSVVRHGPSRAAQPATSHRGQTDRASCSPLPLRRTWPRCAAPSGSHSRLIVRSPSWCFGSRRTPHRQRRRAPRSSSPRPTPTTLLARRLTQRTAPIRRRRAACCIFRSRRLLPAGTQVTADLAFTLTLGDGSFDRIGRVDRSAGRFAWFASAHPLLAWEHGYGWHTEPMLQFAAESATSEAMQHRPDGDRARSGHRARLRQPHDWRPRRRHAGLARHAGRGAGRQRGRRPVPGQRHQGRCGGAAGRRTRHGDPRRARPGVPPGDQRAVPPVRAVSVPLAVGRASPAGGRRDRVPGRDPDADVGRPRRRSRDRPPVVLRDGRRLAGRARVAGRGVRHLRRGAGRRHAAGERRPGAAGPGRPTDGGLRRGRPGLLPPHLRQGRGRAPGRPRRGRDRRRSTQRSAAMSTPMRGGSPSRPTWRTRFGTCPRRCSVLRTAGALR